MFEKVNPCHPDKVADRIAGALVDMAYKKEENPRIAVEVFIGHGCCHIIMETSVKLDPEDVSRAVYRITGTNDIRIDYAETPQDGHLSDNQKEGFRCGDNGIFKGVPVTVEQKELSSIARYISIGDSEVDGRPYSEIVEIARKFITDIGGFEKFAEWGLLR